MTESHLTVPKHLARSLACALLVAGTGYVRENDAWSLGENLAWGTGERGTPRGIHAAWMDSRGHKANILKRSYRDIGIGIHLGIPTDAGVGATFTTEFGVKA